LPPPELAGPTGLNRSPVVGTIWYIHTESSRRHLDKSTISSQKALARRMVMWRTAIPCDSTNLINVIRRTCSDCSRFETWMQHVASYPCDVSIPVLESLHQNTTSHVVALRRTRHGSASAGALSRFRLVVFYLAFYSTSRTFPSSQVVNRHPFLQKMQSSAHLYVIVFPTSG
jgi:hypothetical protein